MGGGFLTCAVGENQGPKTRTTLGCTMTSVTGMTLVRSEMYTKKNKCSELTVHKVNLIRCLLLFSFILDLDTWNEVESLSVPRHEAGCSFSSEYGMVISGGYNDLKSTEYTLDGDEFESLSEPMPVGKNEHCLVALEDGDLFVTGE